MTLYYYLLIALAVIVVALFFDETVSPYYGRELFKRSSMWHQRLTRFFVGIAVCLWIATAIMGAHNPLFWEGLSGSWTFVNVFWNLLFEPFALLVICGLVSLVFLIVGFVFLGLKMLWGWLWQGDANYY